MTNKIWYLKSPIWKHYDQDVKALARMENARIIDARFIGDETNQAMLLLKKVQRNPLRKLKKKKKIKWLPLI